MKIKMDFVTNSSSACFIVGIPPKDLRKFRSSIHKLYKDPDRNDSVYIQTILKSVDDLNEYANGEPLDWVREATGPRFIQMKEYNYRDCKEAIDEGHIITIAWIDYNLTEKFQEKWQDYIISVDNY